MLLRASLRRFSAPCFYALLGVPKDADPDTIKAAYYKLAKLHHPDQQPDPAKSSSFAQYTEAYSTLMDEDKRYDYDLQKGYLTAMDVDRMDSLKERYGSRYGEIYIVARDLWKDAVNIDKTLGEEVTKDPFFAPKALFGLIFRRAKEKPKAEEQEGKLLDDVKVFRQATLLCLGFGFAVSYNATVYLIESYLYPTSPPSAWLSPAPPSKPS